MDLQRLAGNLGLSIPLCPPPRTSMWQTIEEDVFCQVTQHRRGLVLASREVEASLIGYARMKH